MTLFVLATGAGAASASDWYGYPQPHQKGGRQHILAYGCTDLRLDHRASYYFDHRGQDASMYDQVGCPKGAFRHKFKGDSERDAAVGWRSIKIHCN